MTTTLPTIHLNGTGAQNLEEEYRAVRQSVSAAGDALQAATCNARDFYPQEPGAWQRARAERDEAFRLLQLVSNYAEQWEAHAADARRARSSAMARDQQAQPLLVKYLFTACNILADSFWYDSDGAGVWLTVLDDVGVDAGDYIKIAHERGCEPREGTDSVICYQVSSVSETENHTLRINAVPVANSDA